MRQPDHPMHLLDATMFWNPSGGVRRYVLAKGRFIEQHGGWRHTIANPTPDAPDQPCIPSVPLPGSHGAYRLPLRRAAAARVLRAVRPDLIESADPYRLAWASLDAAQALGVPAVAFCHSNLEQLLRHSIGQALGRHAAAAAARLARRYAARLYRQFDLVLAPSRAMTAHLNEWGVAKAQHQSLGVDSALFHPARADPAWRQSLGLPAGTRLLAYAGRFAPEKNLPTLVQAVHKLGPRFWLLAIGAGPMPPRGERVFVQPLVRDPKTLASMIASCDLFVHAGAHETFGLSVLEALACGVPVVVRAAEGLAEQVDSAVGHGVQAGGAAEFAEAIAAVFEADRATLAAAARARAEASDWSAVLPRLWQHYDRLTDGPVGESVGVKGAPHGAGPA
ncbi:MAG: glycosyltransferase [Burkholderiales bacterium]